MVNKAQVTSDFDGYASVLSRTDYTATFTGIHSIVHGNRQDYVDK